MLAPPNQGSEIVDVFRDFGLYEKTMGPAALQLGTGGSGIMSHFGPVDFGLGVIAAHSAEVGHLFNAIVDPHSTRRWAAGWTDRFINSGLGHWVKA